MLHMVSHILLYQHVQNLYCTGTKNKSVAIVACCDSTRGEFCSQFDTFLVLLCRVRIRASDKAETLYS